MEIEIEGFADEELVLGYRAVPGRQQAGGSGVIHARGILAQITLLRNRVEPTEQRQAGVGYQRHHVALALDGPQLQGQGGAQRMR